MLPGDDLPPRHEARRRPPPPPGGHRRAGPRPDQGAPRQPAARGTCASRDVASRRADPSGVRIRMESRLRHPQPPQAPARRLAAETRAAPMLLDPPRESAIGWRRSAHLNQIGAGCPARPRAGFLRQAPGWGASVIGDTGELRADRHWGVPLHQLSVPTALRDRAFELIGFTAASGQPTGDAPSAAPTAFGVAPSAPEVRSTLHGSVVAAHRAAWQEAVHRRNDAVALLRFGRVARGRSRPDGSTKEVHDRVNGNTGEQPPGRSPSCGVAQGAAAGVHRSPN